MDSPAVIGVSILSLLAGWTAHGATPLLESERLAAIATRARPFTLAASADAVAGVREGKAAVAARLFAAEGCAGQTPAWKLEFDGNEQGAGRLLGQKRAGDGARTHDSHVGNVALYH